MSFNKLEVDTVRVKGNNSTIRDKVELIQADKEKLETLLGKDLSAAWKGDAKNAFDANVTNSILALGDACVLLNEILDCFEDSMKEYENSDSNVMSIIESIKI